MTLPQMFYTALFIIMCLVCLVMCASTTALIAAAVLGVRP